MQTSTQPHKADQPGLRGHSHDPENDLMKRYLVTLRVPAGWLGVASFDTRTDAMSYVDAKFSSGPEGAAYAIESQF